MALSLFWLCWNDSANDKKLISTTSRLLSSNASLNDADRWCMLPHTTRHAPAMIRWPWWRKIRYAARGPLAYTLCPNVVRRHSGFQGYKIASVVAARARRRSVCRRLLRLSRKICLLFPAATVFNLGENQFMYVSETHINPYIERFKACFCMAMAWLRGIRTSAASQSMYLNEVRRSEVTRRDAHVHFSKWTSRSCDKWLVSVCYWYVLPSLVHVDIGGVFWGYANQAVWGATFDDKNWLFWAHSRADWRNGSVKLFYFLLSRSVANISAQFV